MALGDKLKETLDALEEARIQKLEDQARADREAIEREKRELQHFVDTIYHDIVYAIEAGKVPKKRVENYNHRNWIEKAQKGEARFQSIWSDFIRKLGKEKLRLVTHEDHDGVGVKSWTNVTVEPIKDEIVYRNKVAED